MRALLGPGGRARLERFARGNVLLAFDFDGTLAPIVRDPARAGMRPTTRKLLAEVARRYPCAVISGRARGEVLRMLGPVPVMAVAGNHGLEPWAQGSEHAATVRAWRKQLAPALRALPGVQVEDKRYSLAIHYRNAANKRGARAAVHKAAEALEGARLLGGKQVLNLVPEGAPDKGQALERFCDRLFCEAALYVGDDLTDEDVFATAWPKVLGVRVGQSRSSQARWYLRTQREIDGLLRALLTVERPGPAPVAPRNLPGGVRLPSGRRA
jgi:trehalose 6-phosphate phosphatase